MKRIIALLIVLSVSTALFARGISQTPSGRTGASAALTADTASQPNAAIKNIIVMIPDGMSAGGVALARWYKAYDASANAGSKTVDTSAVHCSG